MQQEPQGEDALSRTRRKVRRRLLSWAPLPVWRGAFGIAVLLTAGILRKTGIIQSGGFDLLLAIGLSLLGWQMTVNGRKNGGK